MVGEGSMIIEIVNATSGSLGQRYVGSYLERSRADTGTEGEGVRRWHRKGDMKTSLPCLFAFCEGFDDSHFHFLEDV